MSKQEKNLTAYRHTLAHILMQALEELYEAIPGVGPAIEDGFYHDFDCSYQVKESDLPKIEEKMKEIIKKNLSLERQVLPIGKGKELLKKKGYKYTLELAEDLEKEGEKEISFYKQGDFINMCRGPHLYSTGEVNLKSFKLTKIAGAYWKGDERNKMIQRIYGVAFFTPKELRQYLEMLKEAEKRDHRKLGKELDLFVFSDVVGKGLPLWTPKGAVIRRELENFVVEEETKRGYQHVYTPDIAKLDLYKKSGHYPYYKDSMYAPIKIDEEEFMLRPMTCPHHFELYLSRPRSYRDLPMRIAELAKLYRYEQSGELSGLIRVRGFCLADAHIICANEEQAGQEIERALDLIEYIADIFGLEKGKDYWYRLSLGDRNDDKKYYKDDRAWDKAEDILRGLLKKRKVKFTEAENEAAFYGPKIDIQMRNVRGKDDTAFTVQYDFVMPKRFNLKYIDKDGQEKETIVVHRSSIGAVERTIAFLIEHYGGAFPVWLAPVQVKIISVGKDHRGYCQKLTQDLKEKSIRAEADLSDETVGNKIRKAVQEKTPYILVIGDKEVESGLLAVRKRGEKKITNMEKAKFIEEVLDRISKKK